MQIVTQISRKKIHKVLILGLLKVLIRKTKTSHSDDRNRTSSLFGLFPGLSEESVEASPLRRRAASSPTSLESSWKGGCSPLPNHPPKAPG